MFRGTQAILYRIEEICEKRFGVLVKGLINLAFRMLQGCKGDLQQLIGHCQRAFFQLVGHTHFVDQSQGHPFLGRKTATEEAEPFGGACANDPGKAHWSKRGYQPLLYGRNAENGIRRSDAQIAGQSDLQSTTQAVALDGGNRDGVQGHQGTHAFFPGCNPLAGQMAFRQLFGIESTAKGAALTADNHDVCLATLRQVAGNGYKILYPCPVRGIERIWTVETQARQVSLQFAAHCLEFEWWHAEISSRLYSVT